MCCRVNNVHFPLYLIMVQDGHRWGQVVGFAFVKNETEPYIRRIFETLQQANPEATSKVQVVLTDKDFVEQQAVRSVFPCMSLHLCIFHVLRAFSRGISECNLTSAQRQNVCEIFEQLVYADTSTEFDTTVLQLQAYPSAANYFARCWDGCKEQWAWCFTKQSLTFGSRTNNIVKSQNQEIKMAQNGKTGFMASIQKLDKVFALQHDEQMQRNATAVCKSTYVYNSQLPY